MPKFGGIRKKQYLCKRNQEHQFVHTSHISLTLLITKKLENYEERNLETDFSDCAHNLDGARHYPWDYIVPRGVTGKTN